MSQNAISRKRSRRGTALLEFALVVPMLFLLILGIMEFGWYSKNQLTVANASREGVRLASLGKVQSEIRTRVTNSASPVKINSITLQYSQDSGATYLNFPPDDAARGQNNAPTGSLLRVTVRAAYSPLTSLSLFKREIAVPVTMIRERT